MKIRLLVDVEIGDVGHFLEGAEELYDIATAAEIPLNDVVENVVGAILTSNAQYDDLSLSVILCKTDRNR